MSETEQLREQLEQAEQRADEAEEFISRQGMRQAFNQWKPFLRVALTPDEGAEPPPPVLADKLENLKP